MHKHLMRLHRSQRGITGLETAIILIAFVVVASVFAYTVLSAGIFSAE
jgi:archaeal flagellin FlaB